MRNESYVRQIENQPEVKQATVVLKRLEDQGLEIPSIASGWIRGWLTNIQPSDVDVQYAGKIPREEASKILLRTLTNLGMDPSNWDIEGIWNTEIWRGLIPRDYYLAFFVNSIDSVYLASDGKLHDSTGFGFEDAKNKILRMNDFIKRNYNHTDLDIVYVCLRGCERMAKHGWRPTQRSVTLLSSGVERWEKLDSDQQKYLLQHYILDKHKPENFNNAKRIYEKYGWGFVFDAAQKLK